MYWQYGLERYVGLLAPLATSKSQITTSIYNGLENLENVRYVKLIYNILSGSPRGFQTDLINAEGHKYGALMGKGRSTVMTARINKHLNQWYSEFHGVEVTSSSLNCVEWTSVQRLVNVGTAQDFVVACKTNRSQGRARDVVCFIDDDAYGGHGFGRVVTLFSHESPVTHAIYTWALIDSFIQIQDDLTGDIFYRRGESSLGSRLIDIHDIIAPAGLIQYNAKAGCSWIVQCYRVWA